MSKKKVGVTTFFDTQDNYGQLLQAFALQSHLRKEGFDPFLINFRKQNSGSFIKRLKKSIKNIIKPDSNRSKDAARLFDSFRYSNFNFSEKRYQSFEQLMELPPKAALYITGSDQVWNHDFNGEDRVFFLQFGDSNTKRIAFAASFGHANLDEGLKNTYKDYLGKFDLIGVREDSGIDLCKELGYAAQLLPDPTLLLSKAEWSQMASKSHQFGSGNQNILIYLLGNRPLEAKDHVIDYVNNLPEASIVHCTINKDYTGSHYPTIGEWLADFNHADFVVTNSFHGMVFSIIFNKNFLVMPSSGSTKGMNERLTTLLGLVGLNDRVLQA
ncbi:MAG: polysaccharide pyruvyl transferase family protein, partial [Marinoscillum sp.]